MDLIDPEPMRPEWGRVWQGGEEELLPLIRDKVPSPRMIVSMDGPDISFNKDPVMMVMIGDNGDQDDLLPDKTLLAMVETVIQFLSSGFNVLIHCFEGKSRSSYLDVAVHMRVLRYSYDQALGYVKQSHPIAQPNKAFEAQLRNLEATLKGA